MTTMSNTMSMICFIGSFVGVAIVTLLLMFFFEWIDRSISRRKENKQKTELKNRVDKLK